MLSKSAVRAIAIRRSVAAKAGAPEAAVDAAPKAGRRPKAAKGDGFPGDAGKVRLYVSRSELAQALGLPVKAPSDAGAGLALIAAATSQSVYADVDGKPVRTADRLEGVAGLESLHADFGRGSFRAAWFDEAKVADAAGADGFAEGFAALQVASDARAATISARYEGFKAAAARRAEEKLAA